MRPHVKTHATEPPVIKPNLYFTVSTDYLDLHSLAEIFGKIYEVRTKWNNFGLALGMDYNDLAAVKIECRDILDECLKELLARWLKKSRPRPTWKALIEALKSKTVGFEELAEKMTRCKQVISVCV